MRYVVTFRSADGDEHSEGVEANTPEHAAWTVLADYRAAYHYCAELVSVRADSN